MEERANWLLKCYGYHAASFSVVDLFKPSDDCRISPAAFGMLYRSWREMVIGPRGGQSWDHAVSHWDGDKSRIVIEGVRMHPGKSFPTYEEGGYVFKNTYLRPQHEGRGDIKPWLEFMQHLLPDETEREWFCNWLAHKHRHPEIPGVAVIMVAAEQGAGRGILFDIIALLLGRKYVRPIDFELFTGRSSQSAYTDWSAYALMITVNEAKDTAESGRWSERRATYERLKEIVDPRAIERTFTVKQRPAFQALSFASYLIASNNADALQIPEGDRRVTALRNGAPLPEETADALEAWMDIPGNIAEFARWLEARDLSGFSAYKPLVTETKTLMQKLARTDKDDAWDAMKKLIGPKALFTNAQVMAAVQMELGDYSAADEVKRWVSPRLRAEAMKVRDFRMPPSQGRHWILAWRGYDPASLPAVTEAAARSAVDATGKILTGACQSPIAAVVLDLKSHHKPDDEG